MGGMDYPGSNLNGLGGDVGAKQVESANPYTYSDSASQVKTKVKGLSFTANGTTVKMENMSEPFVIWLDGMKLIELVKGCRGSYYPLCCLAFLGFWPCCLNQSQTKG